MDALRQHAETYRRRGFNPLPSRADGRSIHPPFRYTRARDEGLPPHAFLELAAKFECDCVQVPTGQRWGLVVVDLDGPEAVCVWRTWTLHGPRARTWRVQHDPCGGMHVWFASKESFPRATVLWEDGEKHSRIELLGDGALIVAPPSVSPKSGNPYAFLPGSGPDDVPRPALLPDWVADLAHAKQAELSTLTPPPVVRTPCPVSTLTAGRPPRYDARAVANGVTDPIGLARRLGLRVVDDQPNRSGWCRARSLFKTDETPSAMLGVRSDAFGFRWWEPDLGRSIGALDVVCLLGLAQTRSEAVAVIGRLLNL